MNLRLYPTVSERRRAVEKALGLSLMHSGSYTLDDSVASARNCENMIGITQVPLGVAGPIAIRDIKKRTRMREYVLPLATTEGALVASLNRGCKAIRESGGALVHSHKVGATRGPVFRVQNSADNYRLYEFLESHREDMEQVARETSLHIALKKYTTTAVGKYRYVRFVFDTQDAMGLNMVTIATEAIAAYITKKTGAVCVAISGNFCVDKKPSWQNIIRNRGIQVWAEVTVPAKILKTTLKTTAKGVYEVWLAKCMLGSAISGAMGFNAQFANVLSALFLATGQDIAHVGECSVGVTTAEVVDDDLYLSIYLPDLMVGTVGGGTGLATQQEALSMLGVAGGSDGNHSKRLGEIVGASVLAGELSLLASLSEGTLGRAHKTLARGVK